ncbi:MAG: hypothetical protein ABIE84_05210 [bacterium]
MNRITLGTRGILRRPLLINWQHKNDNHQPLRPKNNNRGSHELLPMDPNQPNFPFNRLAQVAAYMDDNRFQSIESVTNMMQEPARQKSLSLAAYLNNLTVEVEGIKFCFSVMEGPSSIIFVAVKVLKENQLSPLAPWAVPWRERQERGLHNAQFIFSPPGESIEENFFANDRHEGLGWIQLGTEEDSSFLYIHTIQEDSYFIDEDRRQSRMSPDHRRRMKLLKAWKYLAVAIVEDLAPRLGFTHVVAPDIKGKNDKYVHLYEGLFGRRLYYSNQPIYALVDPGAIPKSLAWNSSKWWYLDLVDHYFRLAAKGF